VHGTTIKIIDFYLFHSGINLSTAVHFDCFKDGGEVLRLVTSNDGGDLFY